jgi:hypothetical protein
MISQFNVAIFARVIRFAALHLNCNNVGWPVVVCATRLYVKIDTTYCWSISLRAGVHNHLSDRKQFFVKPADLASTVDKVDFQNPMPFSTLGIEGSHPAQVLRMNV